MVVGVQVVQSGIIARLYTVTHRFPERDPALDWLRDHLRFGHGLLLGGVLFALGLAIDLWVLWEWISANSAPSKCSGRRWWPLRWMAVGVQTVFFSFLVAVVNSSPKHDGHLADDDLRNGRGQATSRRHPAAVQAAGADPMMEGPWLSVIMPTYNGDAYLESALQSLVVQTDQDFEVVVVDDGSTDTTLRIIRAYSNHLPMTLVERPHRGNWVANTNLGMSLAKGRYLGGSIRTIPGAPSGWRRSNAWPASGRMPCWWYTLPGSSTPRDAEWACGSAPFHDARDTFRQPRWSDICSCRTRSLPWPPFQGRGRTPRRTTG